MKGGKQQVSGLNEGAKPAREANSSGSPGGGRASGSGPLALGQVGNLFVQNLLAPGIAVSRPDDAYEREADRASQRVMDAAGIGCPPTVTRLNSTYVQRSRDEATPGNGSGGLSNDTPLYRGPDLSLLRSGGQKLPEDSRYQFESRFGRSLDDVRLHTGSSAESLARELNAKAFTLNNHIVFASGQFSPDSPGGKKVLAHELTHVLQQRGHSNQVVQRLGDNPYTDRWVQQQGQAMHAHFERQRRRHERWESSHRARFSGDLGAQGGTLEEEIGRSEQALIHFRSRGLERLSRQQMSFFGGVIEFEANSDMPEGLDAAYGAAKIAIQTLEMALEADEPLSQSVVDAVSGPINSFYFTAVEFARAIEARDQRRAERDRERYESDLRVYGLHQEVAGFSADPVDRRAANLTAAMYYPDPPYTAAPPNSPRLSELGDTARQADSNGNWQVVVNEFQQAERHIDNAILTGLRFHESEGATEIREGLQHYVNLQEGQRELQQEHPSAIRIQAMFYPEDKLVEVDGETVSVAKGIPWQLYLYHTASEAPGGIARSSDHWQLVDLTSGRSLPAFSSSNLDAAMVAEGAVVDPPAELFANFTEIVEFPDGIFYWSMPSGTSWRMPTSDAWGLWEWLQAIGIGLAALALIAGTAGAATPVVVGLGVTSAGVGIASTLAERHEKQRLGTWTEGDEERAAVSIGADIISALSMGLGSVVAAAGRAGRVATFAAANARAFNMLRRGAQIVAVADLAGSMAQVTYASADLVRAFQAINTQPGISDEDKQQAIGRLAMTAMLVGTMGVLSVRGGVGDFQSAGRVQVAPGDDGVLRVARGAEDPGIHPRPDVDLPADVPSGAGAQPGGRIDDPTSLPLRDLDAEIATSSLYTPDFRMAGPVRTDVTLSEGDMRIDVLRSENGMIDSVQFRVPEGFDPHSVVGSDLLWVHNDVVRAYSGVAGKFRSAIARFRAALRGTEPPPLHLQMELWKHRRLASLKMERASAPGVSRTDLLDLETELRNIESRIDDIADAIDNPSRWGDYPESEVGSFGHTPETEHLPPLPRNYIWDVQPNGTIAMRPRSGQRGAVFREEFGAGGVPTGRVTNRQAVGNSGVVGQRLVDPATGTVDPALASSLRALGYDVSRNGVISLPASGGAGALAQGRVMVPLTMDASGRIRLTGVEYGGDMSQFSDADLLTAGTGGISRIEITAPEVPGVHQQVTIQGRLLPGMPRRGPMRPGRAPSYNDAFPIRPAELGLEGRYEILHLWGPGFGDEAYAGLMMGPRSLNQFWQNQRMEDILRSLRDEGQRVGGEVRLSASARSWDMNSLPADAQAALRSAQPSPPGGGAPEIDPLNVPFVRDVTYRFELVRDGQVTGSAEITLRTNPPPSETIVEPSADDIRGLTGSMFH